ncbi:sigma-70 family RNA polymerase sigma factor [Gimesia panareensis]|uniref:RNA polymerase sigma factor n=1 Tax=Gimesia panareensis TaxID=2527978 RepID=A0A518A7M1_9PLAN|nr:sigma-70 family RNA polymerase sigma factor [Gimesia panareensis]QDT26438.1 RNA polymerase sigma factor [Gimesia panareensis]QDU50684.1 RNA polymerase sigma factor [Gimesia panareensis]
MNQNAPPQAENESEQHVRLIAQAQRRLYAFIFALVRHPSDTDDILQETNVVLWRKRATYEPGTNYFAWAFTIARLQVMSHRSKSARRGLTFDDDLLNKIAEAASTESEQYDRRNAALQNCLQKLTASQRDLISRRYQPDGAVNALAAEIGKTSKAVSATLRRVRDKLRECIERTLAAETRS